ncbi:MAPEG family protein [Octadecabacter sp. R77987]|uniref:MAPEG family protein n=1 Tax=Octadecabacter sp. R77987 TaxID=3093874 RepID=UPI00366EDF0D
MTDLTLPITSLAALANGAIYLILTWRVIRMRRRDGIVLGDNGDRIMAKRIRGHANAAEQMPLALIMIALVEVRDGNAFALATLAALFTLGRALHAAYFTIHGTHWRFRMWGMAATLGAQAGFLLLLAYTLVS